MLGLKQFSTPHFVVPSIPKEERPINKLKDFASFLNSLQWKTDDEDAEGEGEWGDDGETPRDVHFREDWDPSGEGYTVANEKDAQATAEGLDPTIYSGTDPRRAGTTRWDDLTNDQLWEQAINSVATGENPLFRYEGKERLGRFDEATRNQMANEERFGIDSTADPSSVADTLNEMTPTQLASQMYQATPDKYPAFRYGNR